MTDLYREALLAVDVCGGVSRQKGSMPSLSALEAERTDVHFLSNSGRCYSSLRPFPSLCCSDLAQAKNFFEDLVVWTADADSNKNESNKVPQNGP